MTLKRGSHFHAVAHGKCPRCHLGDMFVNKNLYSLKDMTKMHHECQVCGQTFFPEPGFYWGAMYMSYILTVFFAAINVVLVGLVFGFEIAPLLIGNAVLLALAYPIFFRYSRIIWLHFNVPFSSDLFEKFQSSQN